MVYKLKYNIHGVLIIIMSRMVHSSKSHEKIWSRITIHFTFKFTTYATTACHVTLFHHQITTLPIFFLIVFFICEKNNDNLVNSLLESGMNCNFSFKMVFLKTSGAEVTFFKISPFLNLTILGYISRKIFKKLSFFLRSILSRQRVLKIVT